MAKKKEVINEEATVNETINNEEIKEVKETPKKENNVVKKEITDNNKGFPFRAIIIVLVFLLAVCVIYFVFMRDNDDKKGKDNKPNNNSSNNQNSNNDPKNDKAYNDILDYVAISSKVKNAKRNVLTKCDCSKVKGETDAEKAVCTNYSVSNDLFISIIDKLKQTKDAKVLPTGAICTTYSFESYDENGREIIMGFTGDNNKSILVGYKEEGYVFNYDKDITSFFESIISFSTKIEPKTPEATELSKDEISLLINKIDKYELLNLRDTEKKVSFSSDKVTNDMMYSMFYYVAGLDDSFDNHWDKNTWSFKKTKADEYFSNAFGFTPKDYPNLVCPVENEDLLVYDKANGTFSYNDEHPGHGGPIGGFIDYKVTSSKKENSTYTIDVLFLRGNEMDGYYVNDEEFNITIADDEDENVSLYKKAFKDIDISKYKKYSFVFEKVKDNFYLKSISYIK